MTGERIIPGLGLMTGFYDEGSMGWKPGMDENLRAISFLVQGAIISRTASVPGSPVVGDRYIITTGLNANKVAVYDDDVSGAPGWVYYTPNTGWILYDENTEELILFNGSSWNLYTSGGSVGAAKYSLLIPTVIQSFTAGVAAAVVFSTAVADVGGWFSGAQPTRLTVPAGVTAVRVTANVNLASATGQAFIQIRKNGAVFSGAASQDSDTSGGENENATTGVMAVSPGDYFEVYVSAEVTRDSLLTDGQTWFAIEAVEALLINGTGVDDSPNDGQVYGRKNGDWFAVGATTLTGVNNAYLHMRLSGNVAVGAGATITINWDQTVEDSSSLWSGADQAVKVPAGFNNKLAAVCFATQHTADGTGTVESFLEVSTDNGSNWSRLAQSPNSGIDYFGIVSTETLVRLSTGMLIRSRYYSSAAKTISATAGASYLRMAIIDTANGGIAKPVQTITGSATLTISAENGVVVADSGSALTIKLPANASVAMAVGSSVDFVQKGAGALTMKGDVGVTIRGISEGQATMTGQWGRATATKIATDSWVLNGEHGAVS